MFHKQMLDNFASKLKSKCKVMAVTMFWEH